MNKTYLVIGLIIIGALALIYFGGRPEIAVQPTPETETTIIPEPNATGNVDDAASAILKDLEGDVPPLSESDNAAFTADEQSISGFGETLNANQF